MKVLFVISGLSMGGAERQVVLLSRELARRGHSVCIYCLNREDVRASELRGSRVELELDQKRWAVDFSVLWRLRQHILGWQPDVVHGFLYDGNIYSRLAAIGTRRPVLGSERSSNYRLSMVKRAVYRLTAGMCEGVIANSHAGASFARRMQRQAPERMHVIWNGIDLAEVDVRIASSNSGYRAFWPSSDLKQVCIVGSIKPAKDYPLALQTIRRLVDSDSSWRMVCVGDEMVDSTSEEKERVLAEWRRLGLERHVKFVGNRLDVLEIIGSSDVMLVTSNREGFPNVVLEAMACRTPVASTAYSDVRMILPYSWQVTDRRDPALLAAAVQRCFAERQAVVEAQRAWVEQNATMGAVSEAYLQVYGKLLPFAPDPRRLVT